MSAPPRDQQGPEGGEAPAVSPRYILTVLGSAAAALMGFYAILFTLQATGNLPPPAFSNSLCVDEKLAFHRNHPPQRSPNLLVVGSSVAWRHFDGEAVIQQAPGIAPLNGAFCGLAAHQSVFAANWLLDRNRSIREVVMIASPQDFENCSKSAAEVFNREDADAYVFAQASPWRFYLRYFAPSSLIRNAIEIAGKRSGHNKVDPLVFDRYGSGPLDMEGDRGLYYSMVRGPDPACFAALNSLVVRLQQEGRRLMVVSTPLHPDWKAQGDPQGKTLAAFRREMTESLRGTQAEYWDGDAAQVVSREAFFDAIHIRWSAAHDFSRALGKALNLGSGVTASPIAPMPREG